MQAAQAIITTWSVELESITQSLDDALLLMTDPQALYDELPEGLKALLIQAVFQKLWVLDHRVVGSELTDGFADLLTLEARLAWSTKPPQMSRAEGATYHRQRTPLATAYRAVVVDWKRLCAERPHGLLPVDNLSPSAPGDRSSNIECLVGVIRFKLKNELARYLQEHPPDEMRAYPAPSPLYHRPRSVVLKDRLSDQDVAELIAAFKAGTPKRVLAERYDIGPTSVKKLLREHGVKKLSRYDLRGRSS